MYTFLVIVQVLVAVALVGLILIQHGKGADAGAAFGSGASGTVFGARGSANFLSRTTGWLATAFFGISLALAYLVHGEKQSDSIIDAMPSTVLEQAGEAVEPAEMPEIPQVDQEPTPVVPE